MESLFFEAPAVSAGKVLKTSSSITSAQGQVLSHAGTLGLFECDKTNNETIII